jgi:polyphosphate kinase 2
MGKKNIREFYEVNARYIEELYFLQTELLKLQRHVDKHKLRVAIFFEGRDTAGKGSAIARFTQFLNPSTYRTVALGKPTKTERSQWYFQRYFKRFPNAGQLIFFDRSWYNRALVEPVMGFCTEAQHQLFMEQVNLVEKMLTDDGVILVKFWFSIKPGEQKKRIEERINTPLIQWKVSPVDLAAQEKWEEFTAYKNAMFERTHTEHCPWLIVRGNDREDSRIQSMRYVLSLIDYEDKSRDLAPPPEHKVFKWRPYEVAPDGE